MELDESVEGFSNIFLHLCYEFTEEDMDQDFCKKNLNIWFGFLWIGVN